MDGKRFQVIGSLTGRRLVVQINTPFTGLEMTDMSARWNERPSLAHPMFLASQYDLDQSLQFGRLVLTRNGFRYRNELVAKLILLGVQFPINGLCNMTSSLIYDLTSSEKSLIVTLDNAVQHYDETTARVSMAQEAGLATLHVQTPVPSWEEIDLLVDLSAGFDLAKKTAFVLSERNGQSIVLQGLATLPAMSSIVSGTARLPLSLLNEEKKNSNSVPIKFSLMANGLKTGPLYRPPSNSCRRPRLTGTGRRERLPST